MTSKRRREPFINRHSAAAALFRNGEGPSAVCYAVANDYFLSAVVQTSSHSEFFLSLAVCFPQISHGECYTYGNHFEVMNFLGEKEGGM